MERQKKRKFCIKSFDAQREGATTTVDAVVVVVATATVAVVAVVASAAGSVVFYLLGPVVWGV